MKWKPDHTYRHIGITAFLVVAASMLFYFLLFRTSTLGIGLSKFLEVMNPIIYGFSIAYILNPVMTLLENTVYKIIGKRKWKPGRKQKKTIRVVCTFAAVFLAFLTVYALISSILPELMKSIRSIIFNYQRYVNNVTQFIDETFKDNAEFDAKTTALITEYAGMLQDWLSSEMTPRLDNLVSSLTSGIFNFIAFIKNIFLGIIISIYVLISKEALTARLNRLLFAVFKTPTANRILHNLRFVDEKFGGFIIGKMIDSLIIGVICYICCHIFAFPYAMLISVFIGITNIIPFFGPFIGAVPATVLIFVVDPWKALLFIVFILCLQQFDGNLLGPKILGSSVGVSSFMVIVSILIGSGFFGVTGMIIAVPLCAIVVSVVQTRILRRTKKKGLPSELEAYHGVDKINPNTLEILYDQPTDKERSLYDWIKYRSPVVRSFDEPLQENPWDRTIAQIEREDAEINGVKPDPEHSAYSDEDLWVDEGSGNENNGQENENNSSKD